MYTASERGKITANISENSIHRNIQVEGQASPYGTGLNVFADTNGTIDLTMSKNSLALNQGLDDVSGGRGSMTVFATSAARISADLENNYFWLNSSYNNSSAIMVGARHDNTKVELTLTNNTLSRNSFVKSSQYGALGVTAYDGSSYVKVDLINNIIWGNHTQIGGHTDIRIRADANSGSQAIVDARYPIIGEVEVVGAGKFIGTENQNIDPELDGTGHLENGSPAIDAAQCGYYVYPIYQRVAPYDDIDGDQRPGSGKLTGCDIGADEYKDETLCFPVKSKNGKIAVICL
jgi:hypothetical protein